MKNRVLRDIALQVHKTDFDMIAVTYCKTLYGGMQELRGCWISGSSLGLQAFGQILVGFGAGRPLVGLRLSG